MSRFNPVRAGRSLLARRRNRWLDQVSFCDACSRIDNVSPSVVDHQRRSFNLYVAHAPHSFG